MPLLLDGLFDVDGDDEEEERLPSNFVAVCERGLSRCVEERDAAAAAAENLMGDNIVEGEARSTFEIAAK